MSERIRWASSAPTCRRWAAAAHLPPLARLDELTVTAVATTRQDSARAAADSSAPGMPSSALRTWRPTPTWTWWS